MTSTEKSILDNFRSRLIERVPIHEMVLFGSRARGDADPDSDLDVLVVTEGEWDWDTRDYISRCAWEAGFEEGIIVVPVVFSRDAWENGCERSSLLAQAVREDGVPI